MTNYAFPAVTPNTSGISYTDNVSAHTSYNGAIQTRDIGGEFLTVDFQFSNLKVADYSLLTAYIAKLNGAQHRVILPFKPMNNQGLFGGTPLVNGASQTGKSLIIDGCSNSITGWIKAGDVFSVNNELKICTDDASSDGSGNITINFSPRLRAAPADGASIETTAPTGIFILQSPTGWTLRPGVFSDLSMQFVEDIAA